MDFGFFDTLVAHFVAAFARGFGILSGYGPRLFRALGYVAWGVAVLQILTQGANVGAIFVGLILLFLSISIYGYVLTNIEPIATGLFTWFAGLGAQVGGVSAAAFLSPSTVLTMGFTVAKPLMDVILRLSVVQFFTSFWTVAVFFVAMAIIVVTFFLTTRHVIMAILEFHLALMVAPVLFPWAVLSYSAFLGEFIVSWLLACCVRIFLVSAVLGIGQGLVKSIVPATIGGDPTFTSALLMAGASWLFFVLASQVAQRAETVGGRGYALGIQGMALVPPGVSSLAGSALQAAGGAVASAGMAAIRAVSSLVQSRRGS